MISLIFLLVSCMGPRTVHLNLGAVDMIDREVCLVQLVSGEIIEIESKVCNNLREGDVIKVVRSK